MKIVEVRQERKDIPTEWDNNGVCHHFIYLCCWHNSLTRQPGTTAWYVMGWLHDGGGWSWVWWWSKCACETGSRPRGGRTASTTVLVSLPVPVLSNAHSQEPIEHFWTCWKFVWGLLWMLWFAQMQVESQRLWWPPHRVIQMFQLKSSARGEPAHHTTGS